MYSRQEEKRQYYLRNRQRIIDYNKQYYRDNIDDKLAYQAERERDPDVKKRKKEYYEKNKPKILDRQRNNKPTLAKQNEKQKLKSKKRVAELDDIYVAAQLGLKGGREVYAKKKELLDAKRAVILLTREIRKHDKK